MHSRRRSHRVRPRHVFAALVAVGLLLRVLTFNSWGIVYDGAVMSVMGESFALHGEFLVPYAPGVVYYHHYPPLYPVFLSLFYRALGFGVFATKLAELVLSALLVVVTWLTTADLFGRRKAWYAAAFVALEPMFLITSLIGYSEDLVGILFVLTAWAAVKGLRKLPYLFWAGVFAGLGFLAKADIGWVFVVTIVMGALWLRRVRGWWILRDKWFLAGVAAFALLAGGWTLRNLSVYGWPNYQTSTYLTYVYAYGFAHPALLAEALVVKVPLFLIFFLLYAGFFLPEVRLSRGKVRGEETGLLWTIVGSTFLMGWIVSAFFWTVEQTPLWWWDNLRYVVITSPLILWLVLRETEPRWSFTRAPSTDLRDFSRRFAALMAVFLAIALAIYAAMLWTALGLLYSRAGAAAGAGQPRLRRFSWVITALVAYMVFTGGFVAGTHAGFAYNTFPLMNGHWIPQGIFALQPWPLNFFNNLATVQFDHRLGAWLLALLVPWFWLKARTAALTPRAGGVWVK